MRVMKRITLVLLLSISSIFVFLPPAAYGQDFTINDFSAAILVNKDSSFTVKETLTVEFHRPRHGLYREIPFIYTDSLGRKIKTPLEVLSVEDANGNKLKAKIMKKVTLFILESVTRKALSPACKNMRYFTRSKTRSSSSTTMTNSTGM